MRYVGFWSRNLARPENELLLSEPPLTPVQESLYFANVSLGTPAQKLRLVIDTGSSDLWVNAPNSTLCEEHKDYCDISGTYDSSDSSSVSFVSENFNITYADSSGASGNYLTDTVTIGGSTLKDFQFGVGYQSTSAGTHSPAELNILAMSDSNGSRGCSGYWISI